MIDQIWVPPWVHFWLGSAVLVTTFSSCLLTAGFSWKKRRPNRLVHAVLVVTQLSLMVQVLVGVKLLDQGLGPLQLYIHYLGGLGALFFYVLFYWLPVALRQRRWTLFGLATLGFLFSVMTFFIGSAYVAH